MNLDLLYNDPLDDFLEQTRNNVRGRVRERGTLSGIESTPEEFRGTGVPYSEALQERSIADALYPVREGLNDEEADRLNSLGRRAEQLNQPTPHRSVGTPSNPGNPFSLDTRGLSGSVTRIGAALKDRQNEKTLGEISPELRELGEQQRLAQESAQNRDEYMKDRVGKVIDDTRERNFEAGQNNLDRENDLDKIDRQGQNAVEREEKIGERMKEVEQLKSDLANDPNNPETRKMYVSAINNYVKASNPDIELIPDQISQILRQSGDNPTEEQKEAIEQLRSKYRMAQNNAARMYVELGAVPSSEGSMPGLSEIEIMRSRGIPESDIKSYAEYVGLDYDGGPDQSEGQTGSTENTQRRGRFDP